MACFEPLPAYRTAAGTSLKYNPDGELITLPCGTCIGCRTATARSWAIRCTFEAQQHNETCWVTLTYENKHVPPTLEKKHLAGYIKRVRSRLAPARAVRFFACGEYGERRGRPHYHAIMYGTKKVDDLYDAWPFGRVQVDDLTSAAIAYVAGYAAKKLQAPSFKAKHRPWLVDEHGEEYQYQPPFLQMSRNPGIGAKARDDFPRSWRNSVIWQGREFPVPRYLHNAWLKMASPEELAALKRQRENAQSEAYNELQASGRGAFEKRNAKLALAIAKYELQSQRRDKL